MVDQLEKRQCSGCELCVSICPVGAITMEMDSEGFCYPCISHDMCIKCGKCDKVCVITNYTAPECEARKAYACRNTDEDVRSASTSGGVFTPLAKEVLQDDGVVYGVKFNQNWSVTFGRAETYTDAMKFRLSKYPQASVHRIYENVKEDLGHKRKVLFTGTPCQVSALKKYLNHEYDQLFTLDLVCLGVASPGIWEWYLDHAHNRGEISEINFKSKVCGWKDWHILFHESGVKTWESNRENNYMHDFCTGINTRPSCFECPFKGVDSESDFTVSDCWGIGESLKINDDKGLSALIIHTKKGLRLFEKVKKCFVLEEHDAVELMKDNRAVFGHLYVNTRRDDFFHHERWKGWKWSGKEY